MHTVVIIGAGQLGSRHLQGLGTCSEPLSIHLIDPSVESLSRARQRFEEIEGASQRHSLHVATRASDLPRQVDLAISATTADIRLASLRPLLDHAKVSNLVFEKILFQTLAEYDVARTLLDDAGTRTWVNCPRRMFPFYAALKDFFADEPPTLMQVTGSNWGLGCNGVHFCDLFAFLTGDSALQYDTALLDLQLHASKRAGFFEFSGTLVGRHAGRQIELQSTMSGNGRHLIVLRSPGKAAVVDEIGGVARLITEGGEWSEQRFNMLYQSQLSGLAATDILANRPIALPNFEVSARIHTAFLAPLLDHYNRVTGQQATACPIT